VNNSFNSIIESGNSFLILLPKKPFFDQVAAGLGLFLSLRDKKEAAISCPTPMVVEFNRLVGVNKISSELGNKNLTIKFSGYDANKIERVSYDIENGEFRLTVIPKPGAASPIEEQIKFSHSGVSADTVLLVGGANENHFPNLASPDLVGTKLVHIGTRALSSSSGKNIISLARPASSVSELVTTLIKESGMSLDVDISTNLLIGIEEASNKFSSSEVTANTFEVVAELMRAGGQRRPQVTQTRGAFPPSPIQKQVSSGEQKKETPKDWLEPKVYKGTTIS
jgi:hypothetical protein